MEKLDLMIKESAVNEETSTAIKSRFESFFIETEKWKDKALELVVTDISQVGKMQDAMIARKAVTAIRLQIESTRKELKEDSLRKGQLIDRVAKTLKERLESIETHLKEQEQFKLRYEAAKKEKLKKDRELKLLPYGVDTAFIDLANMPEEKFQTLLENSISIFNEKVRKEKEVEEERLKQIEIEAQKQKELEAENKRLKEAAEARELEAKAEREANEKAMQEQRNRAEAERKAIEEKAQKEREEAAQKLKAEQEQKAKLEAELKAKKEAEAKAEKEAKAAEKKARLAPDKDKLLKLAETIQNIELPVLKNEESEQIINNIRSLLGKVVTYTKSQAEIL